MKNSKIITICGAVLLLSGCQQPYSYGPKPQSYPYTTTQVVDVNNTTSSSSSSSTTPSYPTRPVAKTAAEAAVVKNVADTRNDVAESQTAGRSSIPHYSEDGTNQ